MTSGPRVCTGRRRNMGRSIFGGRGRRIRRGVYRWQWRLAPIQLRSGGMLPIPPDLDEMMFAGFLRRDSVEMVPCETNDLEVPANAEIVLEGYVNLNEMRTEGPFGDHTASSRWKRVSGFPRGVRDAQERADLPHDGGGAPPQEDFYMGYAVERVFLPVMKMQYPEIVDVAMPGGGNFHNLMIVAIRKSYPGHARKIMNAIWSLGQAMFTR